MVATQGLPHGWCYCFNDSCPQRETCVRYLSKRYLPASAVMATSVVPNAWHGGPCKAFCQLRTIKVAWGFDALLYEVKARDLPTFRLRLTTLLGCKSQYYRYKLGQKKLSPEQQTRILRLFSDMGYEGGRFDHYGYEVTTTD